MKTLSSEMAKIAMKYKELPWNEVVPSDVRLMALASSELDRQGAMIIELQQKQRFRFIPHLGKVT